MSTDPLRAKLIEDTGSAAEADELLPAVRRLPDWSAPAPTAAETDRLVQAITAARPAQHPNRVWRVWWPLLRAQARIVQQEIWIASALVMVLGCGVTLARPAESLDQLPLMLIAPVVAALGIAFLYGPAAEPTLEIELATPISSRLIVLARLLLVFAFDLALGLLGSALLVLTQSGWSWWPLVAMWLAPMTFLAALAFLLSMIFSEPLIGATVCLALWGAQTLRQFLPVERWPTLLSVEAQPWLWLMAAGCAGVALWLAGREERWLTRPA
jgi:hypothetical protein